MARCVETDRLPASTEVLVSQITYYYAFVFLLDRQDNALQKAQYNSHWHSYFRIYAEEQLGATL
jgi:hypothetical protein